jgi:hypothetical protein
MTLSQAELEMAKGNFGYGRWEAQFWFIGPEQGMGKGTKDDIQKQNDENLRRLRVWQKLGSRELNDCCKFHDLLGERRWHFEPIKPQTTWRPLILFLQTFLGRPIEIKDLKRYQANQWGTADSARGETCVIELSGIASPNLAKWQSRSSFLEERVSISKSKFASMSPKSSSCTARAIQRIGMRSGRRRTARPFFSKPRIQHVQENTRSDGSATGSGKSRP